MHFKLYDNLRVFDIVARHMSFAAASKALNVTKGAVSYQIAQLESELGFKVFERLARGVQLTAKGRDLWRVAQVSFMELEREISRLQENTRERVVIGMSTYFASRWLSPRLMKFMADHPKVGLRLQPMIDLMDVRSENIDLAVRWGAGDWNDMLIEPLFRCPALVTAGAAIQGRVLEHGLSVVLRDTPLLHDREGSLAWRDWHKAAGFAYHSAHDGLVIPDPNVRVQAVIDGQGLALNDSLVSAEIASGLLFVVSEVRLSNYGYHLAYPEDALVNPGLKAFRDWIVEEAGAWGLAGPKPESSA